MATKYSPWTPRFGSPSIQFMIIFQKKFSASLAQHKYCLGKLTIFHFVFIIMYIIVHYIDLGCEQSSGWPRHRENREFGSYFFQTGKTQGILF